MKTLKEEYYVCSDPKDYDNTFRFIYSDLRSANEAAKLRGLWVVQLTYTFKNSTVVYQPQESK